MWKSESNHDKASDERGREERRKERKTKMKMRIKGTNIYKTNTFVKIIKLLKFFSFPLKENNSTVTNKGRRGGGLLSIPI